MYKAYLQPLLTYASPGWFSFISVTNITKLEHRHRATGRAISGCLSFSPIPLLLSEVSLTPLPVTLTYFALSCYERALSLPKSFSILGLATLGVKPRLCRFSWRAFAPTYTLMIPSTSSRGLSVFSLPFLLRTCLRSLWSPPFPLHAAAVIYLSLAKGRHSLTLTLSNLTIWCFGQMPLFLILLAKAALAYLPTAISVALRPLFPFWQAQCAQIFPLKPAPFSKPFPGLGINNKSAIFLLFCSYLTFVLSSPPYPILHLSFYLNLSGISGRNYLFSSCSIRLQWVPGHSFLSRNDAADELARWESLLVPSEIPCSLSPLISHIHSCLFSDWRRTVSSKFFDTQVPSISTEELVLLRHARCVLSRLCCNGHSLLLSSYLSRIGRTENSSYSACGHPSQDTSHLILHCPATDSLRRSLFGDSLSLYDLWSRPWGVGRLLGLDGLLPCPIPRKGLDKTTYSTEFRSLSSTNSDFEFSLTLIINLDLLSVLTTPIDSNLSE